MRSRALKKCGGNATSGKLRVGSNESYDRLNIHRLYVLVIEPLPVFVPLWIEWLVVARDMVLMAINQLWRADITYIRLRDEFVFLAVILDAYSRRVIGWALDRTMEDSLTLTALRMALLRRAVEPGLVHHSDRGSQYASNDYTDLLKAHGIEISMSRKGNPWDNAACESFMKTLKYEEVLRNEYRDLADARASIREFLEKIYNQKRLHSALGYMPPARFERNQKDAAARQLSV